MIFAADGPALSTPAFRQVVEAARPHIPPMLACVVEAATTSEAIAGAIDPDAGTLIVLVTRAVVAHCPALSRIGEHLYVATIGAGQQAADRAHSVLGAATWERARPYLLREPVAFAAELPSYRAIAVAQPDPVEAWVAIDAADVTALGKKIGQLVEPLRSKLVFKEAGSQLTIHTDKMDGGELARLAAGLLEAYDTIQAAPPPKLECPPPGEWMVSCADGTSIKLHSIADFVRELSAVDAEQVVSGNDVIGIRFTGDPPHLLRRNDVLLGIGAHRITDGKQLAALAKTVGDHASMAVRRDGVEVVLDLTE